MVRARVVFTLDPVQVAAGLTKGLRNKAMRIALNKAAGVVKGAIHPPKRYGYLLQSLRIKTKNYKGSDVWVAIVGPKSNYTRKRGKVKRGPNKGQPITFRPSAYASLVERGTRHSAARPYLLPALRATAHRYIQTLKSKLAEQVKQLLPQK